MRGAEVAQNVFLGVAALLRADDDYAVFAQFRETADHRAILGEQAVAVQFVKIRECVLDVIQRVRALGMPRKLDALPGREVQENLPPGFFQFFFDELDFLFKTDAQGMFFRMQTELVQLVLQLRDRLFEIKLMFHAWGSLMAFPPESMRISGRLFTVKKAKGRTCVRPLLVTRFIRPHPGAQKGGAANLGSLSEPHHEQNPYANPKRTAKTQTHS
jgi:hypothetical protein